MSTLHYLSMNDVSAHKCVECMYVRTYACMYVHMHVCLQCMTLHNVPQPIQLSQRSSIGMFPSK